MQDSLAADTHKNPDRLPLRSRRRAYMQRTFVIYPVAVCYFVFIGTTIRGLCRGRGHEAHFASLPASTCLHKSRAHPGLISAFWSWASSLPIAWPAQCLGQGSELITAHAIREAVDSHAFKIDLLSWVSSHVTRAVVAYKNSSDCLVGGECGEIGIQMQTQDSRLPKLFSGFQLQNHS